MLRSHQELLGLQRLRLYPVTHFELGSFGGSPMSLVEFLANNEWAGLLGALAIGTYAIFVAWFLTRSRIQHASNRDRFFKALDTAFESKSASSLHDVVNLYKGVMGLSSEDLAYRAGLSKSLREYLVRILEAVQARRRESSDLPDVKKLVSDFIAQNDKTSPYADLPDLERSVISDIAAFLEVGDASAVQRKMGELASAIQARADDFARVQGTNRWSVPLAVVGLILTVVFGLVSLVK